MIQLIGKMKHHSRVSLSTLKECIPGDICPRNDELQNRVSHQGMEIVRLREEWVRQSQEIAHQSLRIEENIQLIREEMARLSLEMLHDTQERAAFEIIRGIQDAARIFSVVPDDDLKESVEQLRNTVEPRNRWAHHLVVSSDPKRVQTYKFGCLSAILCRVSKNEGLLSEIDLIGIDEAKKLLDLTSDAMARKGVTRMPPPDFLTIKRVDNLFRNTLRCLGVQSIEDL